MTEPNPLMNLLLGVLAPLLMAGAVTDIQSARLAARQAIDAYNAQGQDELLSAAQIVGFTFAALDDLRLSMQPDLPLPVKLRLRGNANALGRAALRNSETLRKSPRAAAASRPEPAPPAAEPTAAPAREQQQQWADGMTKVAADLRARTRHVAPAQQRADQIWAEVLTDLAGELRRPGKAGLLSSTALATG